MPNKKQQTGAGKLRNALYGRDQFGLRMSEEDRKKLLRSGGEDIVAGNKAAQEGPGRWARLAEKYANLYAGVSEVASAGLKKLGQNVVGTGEAGMTIGSSVLADVPAGWTGLMASDDRAVAVEGVQNALTYQPRSEAGKRILGDVGNALQNILEPATRATDYYLAKGTEYGVRPSMLAIPAAALTAGLEMVPGKRGTGSAGRWAAKADEYAQVLRHDPTAGGRAAVMRDMPESRWNEAIPENTPLGQTDVGASQRGSVQDTGGGKRHSSPNYLNRD